MVESRVRVKPKARRQNLWQREGKALVSIVSATGDVKEAVRRSLDLLGGMGKLIQPGDSVLLKPNLVRDYPPPVSTALDFLRAVIDLLREAGATKITVGELTGRTTLGSTRTVYTNLGYYDFAHQMGIELMAFEEEDWLEVEVSGQHWQSFLVPRPAYEADKLIYLPSLKTHFLARFTGALKLAVGFTHLSQRDALHAGPLEEKVAELNLAWQPDLIITDARKSFITGGPADGDVVEPGLILASGDLVAIDVESVRILQQYRGRNLLNREPWDLPMIRTAVGLGLGARSDGDYSVVRA